MDNIKRIIPIYIRKRIVFFFQKLFIAKTNHDQISKSAKLNLKNNDKKGDIIIFSVIGWSFRFQRPQQLAKQLSQLGYRVFYIENEFSLCDQQFNPVTIKQVANDLFTVKLSSQNNYFIYQQLPSLSDQKIITKSINHLFQVAKIINPKIIVDHPFWTDIALSLGFKTIYDCMDYHQGFPHFSPSLIAPEIKLITKSDLVIVSSSFLKDIVHKYRKDNCYLINNALDDNNFQPQLSKTNNKHPTIGYFGALEDWLDTDLIEQIAKSSSYPLIFAGQNNNQKLHQLSQTYPQIKLLGEINYSQIPQLLSTFDICLIPFKITLLIQATDPVKIYEYFSAGKPVICTDIPQLHRFDKLVYFASRQTILNQISLAINESDQVKKQRIEIASKSTWRNRTLELINILESA